LKIGANILVNNQGQLQIGDFGLARSFDPDDKNKEYTNMVVTRWYRPPELLLGETRYTCAIDMWGLGYLLYYYIIIINLYLLLLLLLLLLFLY